LVVREARNRRGLSLGFAEALAIVPRRILVPVQSPREHRAYVFFALGTGFFEGSGGVAIAFWISRSNPSFDQSGTVLSLPVSFEGIEFCCLSGASCNTVRVLHKGCKI